MSPFDKEDKSPVKEEAYTSTHKPLTVGGQSQVTVGTTHISRLTDEQLIKEFLSGSYCLHGVRMDGFLFCIYRSFSWVPSSTYFCFCLGCWMVEV